MISPKGRKAEFVAIGDIFKVSSGGTPSRKKNEYFSNGNIPWIKTGDLKGKFTNPCSEFITQLGLDNSSAKLFPPKTVLLAMYGATIGACSILPFEAATNQACAAILPNDKCDENFLYYYLTSIKSSLIAKGVGGAQPNISAGLIKTLTIPLPSLAEQQKIASVLDAADSLRQKDQQLIEKYTALSQSLFLEMFGDPVSNPMDWDKKLLNEVGVVYTGNTPPRANLEYYGNDIEWIKTNNINTPNMYLTLAEESLSNAGLSVGRSVEVNSLLVTCIAGSKKVIGNVAIANRKVAFNQQINSFTPFKGNILYYYYLFIVGKKHVQSFSTNSMKGMINKSKFESIDFIAPPITLQNQFAERIQAIEAQKQQAQASLKKSEDLFNSLLQRAFKGELTTSKSANHDAA